MIAKLISLDRSLRIGILLSGFFITALMIPFSGDAWFIFFILCFTFLGLLIYTNGEYAKIYSQKMKKSLAKSLNNINFQADNSYLSDDYKSAIALNKSDNKIVVFQRFDIEDEFIPYIYKFNDILECAIQEDEETTIKTVNSSLIGRSVAGGILFGATGSMIGALTGEKVTKQKIYRATLFLTFNDLDYPIRGVNFLNSNMLVDKNSELYRKIHDEMNKWYKTISVIIKRNERELNSKTV